MLVGTPYFYPVPKYANMKYTKKACCFLAQVTLWYYYNRSKREMKCYHFLVLRKSMRDLCTLAMKIIARSEKQNKQSDNREEEI